MLFLAKTNVEYSFVACSAEFVTVATRNDATVKFLCHTSHTFLCSVAL